MDINLRLPPGEHDKEEEDEEDDEEEEETSEYVNMLQGDGKTPDVDGLGVTIAEVVEKTHADDLHSPLNDIDFKDVTILEPLPGMEFASHADAYAFYQEYARSVGFNTAIQNSRRSKTSREFIDAKFACSRYGTKRDYDKSLNRPRSRQSNQQDSENASGRRACSKTDCKASMHVKRRSDGKWLIHRFEKEHNHELLPAQAVSEQTKRMYAAMARQFAEYKSAVGLTHDSRNQFHKDRNMSMDVEEVNTLLQFFPQMLSLNPNFFYAVDVGDDHRLKNILWIDAKSRLDYLSFNDVVSFDMSYIRNKYKIPLALFIGVNQYYQFILLGCALLSEESTATFSWVMRTWLQGMSNQAPKYIITDSEKPIKSAVSEVFPSTLHYFSLWHIMGKVSENFNHIIKENECFMTKFEKCIHRSWSDEEFQKRWCKLGDRFGLKGNELFHSLYDERSKWVPGFVKDGSLIGMSTLRRSESVNSFFDKYVHKKTTVQEFINQYESVLQDRYEDEAKAFSFETWNKPPGLKSPSLFEKQVAGVYTHAVLKKFQVEVLGAAACALKTEEQIDAFMTLEVKDTVQNQEFTVRINKVRSEVYCLCHLFELKGFLCRHALFALQVGSFSMIPSQYILKRWTKDAKSRSTLADRPGQAQSRPQRFRELCQQAIKLSEEGSLSQESYNTILRAFDDAFEKLNANNSNKNLIETGQSVSLGIIGIDEDIQSGNLSKTNKKKNPTKKRKVNMEQEIVAVGTAESLQHMDKLGSRPVNIDGYFGAQQGVQGMVQLNLMAPTPDNYYGNQQTIQGLGQLNSIAPTHESYYGTQPSIHGLGQMDFFRTPSFSYNIRDEPNVRTNQLHDDTPRHP